MKQVMPYYQDDWVTLYCADNRDVVDVIQGSIVLTDAPYAEQTHVGARTNPEKQNHAWRSGGNEPGRLIEFDSISFEQLHSTLGLYGANVTAWVVSFTDWRHTALLEQQPPDGLRFVRFGIWDKPNGAPQFTGDRPAQGWEAISILNQAQGRMTWNGGGKRAVWTANKVNDVHKTAKPPKIIKELIEDFSNPGDTIIDPWCGIGTTLWCAKQLGRRAIGVEINEAYCQVAVERLRAIDGIISCNRQLVEQKRMDW